MLINLLDGRQADTEVIDFDSGSYHFALNGEDVTNQIKQADKRKFYGFDVARDDDRIYVETYMHNHGGKAPPEVGSDSFITNLYNQLTTRPLQAPLDDLNTFVKENVGDILASSGLQTIVLIGAAGLLAYLIIRKQAGV